MTPSRTTSEDHLVELHVLAENGDAEAAAEAARVIAADGEARRVWETVESDCRQLRQESSVPGPGQVGDTRVWTDGSEGG
jgi:hypothetical protein